MSEWFDKIIPLWKAKSLKRSIRFDNSKIFSRVKLLEKYRRNCYINIRVIYLSRIQGCIIVFNHFVLLYPFTVSLLPIWIITSFTLLISLLMVPWCFEISCSLLRPPLPFATKQLERAFDPETRRICESPSRSTLLPALHFPSPLILSCYVVLFVLILLYLLFVLILS